MIIKSYSPKVIGLTGVDHKVNHHLKNEKMPVKSAFFAKICSPDRTRTCI